MQSDMDAAERKEILSRYRDHSRRFEAAAARRSTGRSGAVIPFNPPVLRELAQEPTAREIEALQLVADAREPGNRAAPLPLGGNGPVKCAAPSREAASTQ